MFQKNQNILLFIILKRIAITIKTTEENQKLVELLFVNIKERRSKFKIALSRKINDINSKYDIQRPSMSEYGNRQTKKTPIFSKFKQISNVNNKNENYSQKNALQNKFGLSSKFLRINRPNDDISYMRNNNSNSILLNVYRKSNDHINQLANQDDIKVKSKLDYSDFRHSFYREIPNLPNYLDDSHVKNNDIISNNTKYVRGKLFPYRYYLFSIFFKNIDISKIKFCFPRKFIKVNLFLGQLLDISTYLLLQKEFHVLKNKFLTKEEVNIIERSSKINIGSQTFIRMVNECIENQKFHLFDSKS